MPTQNSQPGPSGNWFALQKKLLKTSSKQSSSQPSRKRRRIDLEREQEGSPSPPPARQSLAAMHLPDPEPEHGKSEMKNGESLPALRKMIFGQMEYTDNQSLPGKYLAIDCEMVGVGIEGAESSLARVTLVNYYGAVQLDEFVRQRERVVDYRTRYSGIRESDMIKAKPFEDIQKQVAELLKDRILIGHAVHNDLKALLLAHPRPQTRDTQYYAGKYKVARSKYVALRNLVKQELDVTIQEGEHSSLTDARATMAVYRLHRKEWEKEAKVMSSKSQAKVDTPGKKRKADDEDEEDEDEEKAHPKGGRKGVSSGLSTITRHRGGNVSGTGEKKPWWKELSGAPSLVSKGSMRLKAKT